MNDLLVTFIRLLGTILYLALIGRVIISWLNLGPSNPAAAILFQITEPILRPIRQILPTFGMLDFSPMVALILVIVVQRVLIGILS